MSTPSMLRGASCAAMASVMAPELHPMSRQRRPWNQARLKTCSHTKHGHRCWDKRLHWLPAAINTMPDLTALQGSPHLHAGVLVIGMAQAVAIVATVVAVQEHWPLLPLPASCLLGCPMRSSSFTRLRILSCRCWVPAGRLKACRESQAPGSIWVGCSRCRCRQVHTADALAVRSKPVLPCYWLQGGCWANFLPLGFRCWHARAFQIMFASFWCGGRLVCSITSSSSEAMTLLLVRGRCRSSMRDHAALRQAAL